MLSTRKPIWPTIRSWFVPLACFSLLLILLGYGAKSRSQQQSGDLLERFRQMSKSAEQNGLAEPFKGITTNGKVMPGLFAIRSTGVSTEPVRRAAESFLNSLSAD